MTSRQVPRFDAVRQATGTDLDQVAVEDRPYPKIQKPTDAVLKVTSTALCVSLPIHSLSISTICLFDQWRWASDISCADRDLERALTFISTVAI